MDSTDNQVHVPDSRQREFDFQRAVKLSIIERARLDFVGVRLRHRMKSLLKVVESHIRDHASCWLSISTIVVEMGASEATVHRAIRDAERAGLLVVNRGRGAGGVSVFSICWSTLLELSRETLDDRVIETINRAYDSLNSHTRGGVTMTPGGVTMTPGGVTMTPGGCHHDTQKRPFKRPLNPPPPRQNKNQASDFESAWVAVVALLDQEKITCGSQSVERARSNGVPPEFVVELIDHARSLCVNGVRAYGSGALARRIERARPGQTADTLWPPASGAYQRELEREARRQPRGPQAPLSADVATASVNRELEELEMQFGAECDQLSAEQRRRMISSFSLQSASGDVFAPQLRGMLLRAIRDRKELVNV